MPSETGRRQASKVPTHNFSSRQCGAAVVAALAINWAFLYFDPLGPVLVLPLERRFPQGAEPDGPVTGIIALGGHLARVIEALRLAHKYPDATLVVSVRGDDISPGYLRAHAAVRGRLVLEWESRTTDENATVAARLVKPKPHDRWLIVTDGAHMPRAMGAFRRAGFNAHAWPTESESERGRWTWQRARHEWLGLLWYRLSGRTTELFPGPTMSSAP